MSLHRSRVSLTRIGSPLVCATIFAGTGGCYHRSPALDELSPTPRVLGDNAQWSKNEQRVRRFPGIDVMRTPSGGFLIRILSGLAADGQPLYVIDDTPMLIDSRRGIDWFKPEDIVRIRVLKTPAETAIYGPNGLHGVILVDTKQGTKLRTGAQ